MGNKLRTFTEGELEIFENICRMSQKQLHKGLKDIFSDMYGKQNVINKEKYLYIQGTTPVLLVAHLDTVFKAPNREIYFDPEKNVIWGGATGLGADDRAGVFGIIWLVSCYEFRPHILFVEDEEIGGHGSISVVKDNIINPENFKYVIELDRANAKDCVFYDCDNVSFMEYVESFGFNTARGSFSDISILCPAWKVAGVNLSIGYQNEHSLAEMLIVHWILETLDKVALMLEDAENAERYEYISMVPELGACHCSYCGALTSYSAAMTIPKEYTQEGREMKKICLNCMPNHVSYCDNCHEFYEVEIAGDKCPECGGYHIV